jgi:hypothetical protein
MNGPQSTPSLSQASILVAGVARNCERTIRHDVQRLQAAFGGCHQLQWLIVESDSSDKTLTCLELLERDIQGFQFRSLGYLAESLPIRTERIAHCRNAYLDELNSNPLYSAIDYVAIADLDGVNRLITMKGVVSCWTRQDWDVCTASQRGPYYDIWALRHPLWSPNDCWRQYKFLCECNVQRELAAWVSRYAKMITIPETSEWIAVDSAFGGLAIYRRAILTDACYRGIDDDNEPICEHVWLHYQLRATGARIFINPRLINTAGTEQSYERSFLQTMRRYLLDLRHALKLAALRAFSPDSL